MKMSLVRLKKIIVNSNKNLNLTNYTQRWYIYTCREIDTKKEEKIRYKRIRII